MLGYLSLDIILSSKLAVFFQLFVRINDNLNCKSKNSIYLINGRNAQSSISERQNASYTNALANMVVPSRITISSSSPLLCLHILTNLATPLPIFFLTPLELIHNKRDSVRKAREAHLINKAKHLSRLVSVDAMNKISFF